MTKLFSYKKKLLLFIAGIFILSFAGFLLISCGAGPQIKTTVPDKGNYAVQFSGAEGIRADRTLGLGSSLLNSSLTLEAWIKTTDALTTSRTFAARGGTTSGAVLFLDNSTNCDPLAVTAGMPVFATDTDAYVCGSSALNDGAWHHVAGVIAMENHTGVHANCTTTICTALGFTCSNDSDSDGSYVDELPHLDLYVDGVYQDCAAPTLGYPANIDNVTGAGTFIGNDNALGTGLPNAPGAFIGTVDEVRLWGVARTASEIWQCRTQELSVFGGTCGINSTNLHGYWKLNEGTGHKATDYSGRAIDGTKYFIADDSNWNGGWVTGYPF